MAVKIINRIEMTPFLSYDYETLEVIIRGQKILHSSIKELIEHVVRLEVPSLPLSFVTFINSLVDMRLPLFFFKNGDALMIRQNLLAIRKQKNNQSFESEGGGEDGNENVNNVENNDSGDNLLETEENVSRKRKLDSDNETENSTPPDEPRRSKRLKLRKDLNKSWSSLQGFE